MISSILGWVYRRFEYVPRLIYYALLILVIWWWWKSLKYFFGGIKWIWKDWRYGRYLRKSTAKRRVYGIQADAIDKIN